MLISGCSGLQDIPNYIKQTGWLQACWNGRYVTAFSLVSRLLISASKDEFIRGFQVFDKEGNGFIGAGELRYVLTQLGEKMSDEEVDELLKGVQIGASVSPSLDFLRVADSSKAMEMSITSPSCAQYSASRSHPLRNPICTFHSSLGDSNGRRAKGLIIKRSEL